jgi:hypothetical protein
MKDIQRKQMADERPPLPKTQQDKLAQMFEFEFAGLRNNEDVVVSRVKPVQRFTEDNNDGDNALTFYSPRKHLPL